MHAPRRRIPAACLALACVTGLLKDVTFHAAAEATVAAAQRLGGATAAGVARAAFISRGLL
ncbi:hypothetical protein Psi02_57210 [Planotetraspora silvatica]|uniref:Uncharacterized protein n=1 Tax=Planotetraspora silvatica TaxID=234614 RepID=A0A8J3XP48_9ACTN|nr:hypothetical protein Psi02_57210 [Planotetraspora silvatica]